MVSDDVGKAVGNLQACAGQQAGGEAAVHSMRKIFEEEDCHAVLLVDASNAFNSINREAMLHNIKIKCPSFSQYVDNTYREPANLYIMGKKADHDAGIIKSTEGTTQGDPVAMAMYALAMTMLQQRIKYETTNVKQVAYADDLTGAGKVEDVRKWWDLVTSHGPDIGYFPNASKSILIVKPDYYHDAQETFRDTEVIVTKEGQRHLGAVIGTREFKDKYVSDKVKTWVEEIQMLSNHAKTEPHAAYTAFTYGVKHKWTFVMRTIPDIELLLQPLEDAIRESFLPSLTNGYIPSPEERDLLALPPRMGGLGITNPAAMADHEHRNSLRLTEFLSQKILAQAERSEINHQQQKDITAQISKERETLQKDQLQRIIGQLTSDQRRRVEMAQEVGASNWLTTLPLKAKGFHLNKQEFVDALALRYGWPVESLPQQCTCGTPFDATHAMVCKKGGFVCIRHDEVRDITAKMLQEVCHDVTTEPILLPLDGERFIHRTANTSNDARVDVSARGFWTRGQRAFVDIRIFDPMAACHHQLSLEAAHQRNEQEKNRNYQERVQHVDHGRFTPLVFTTSGGVGPEARRFYS